jgi:hypothetical protein
MTTHTDAGPVHRLAASGWKITERVQAYIWRDGNRAVVAR